MTKTELQAFWMMGTIVRLSSLGVIFPVPVALNTELCDLYNFLDAKKLFPEPSDIRETLESIISYFVALGCGAPTEKDVQGVEFLVKEYIENPLKLTRMFLEKEMSD